MNTPCPYRINCPGTDDPILNLSSEAPDIVGYIATSFVANPPPGGFNFSANACGRTYFSTISQEDADQQAHNAATLCSVNTWTPPTPPGVQPPPVSVWYNTPQSCTKFCPDGNPFTYTVPAGAYISLSSQADANNQAHTAACTLANSNQICLSVLFGCCSYAPPPWQTCLPASVTSCCAGYRIDGFIHASFGPTSTDVPGISFWEISSGSLPPGLTFHGGYIDSSAAPTTTPANNVHVQGSSVMIEGTCTTSGTYTFTVRVTDSTGSFMERTYTIVVGAITNTLPLTDATEGIAYSLQLTTTGFTSPVFSIVSGSLPTGFGMTASGLITAVNPTTTGTSSFTVRVTGSDGHFCDTALTITVNSATVPNPLNYWQLDSLAAFPTRFLSSIGGATDLVLNTADVLCVAGGIISNCSENDGAGSYETNWCSAAHHYNLENTVVGFTIRVWYKEPNTLNPLNGGGKVNNHIISSRDLQNQTSTPWGIRCLMPSEGTGMVFEILDSGSTLRTVNVAFPSDHAWHRLIGIYDAVGMRIGIKLDNNATVWQALANPIIGSQNKNILVGPGVPDHPSMIDEVAIWSDTVLDDGQMTKDWNSGAGRTFTGGAWSPP